MEYARMKLLAGVVLAALCPPGDGYAAQGTRTLNLRDYEQTYIRDDRERLLNPAGAVCQGGFKTRQFANPAAACFVAYETALRAGLYDHALDYAAIGCRKYQNPGDCRRVGSLPLVMGNQGIPVPVAFAAEVRGVAEFVCLSGARIRYSSGIDVTAAQCSYLARQFRLAKDPVYAFALAPAARQYFAATQDLAFSGTLHQVACERHGHADSCGDARSLGLQIDEKAALLASRNASANTSRRSVRLASSASGIEDGASAERLSIQSMATIDAEDAELATWFGASTRAVLSEQRIR